MTQNTLNITARQFRKLTAPVLPMVGTDDTTPVLTGVKIETRGQWLIATATDRFRVGVHRLKCPDGGEWPEWSALISGKTIRAILASFKPSRQDADPELTLTISGESIKVHGGAALLDMNEASITYPLLGGEFPLVGSLIKEALDAEPDPRATAAFNMSSLAKMIPSGETVEVRIASPHKASLFTFGDDFIGILMPRRTKSEDGDFRVSEDWADILASATPRGKGKAA